MKKRMLMEMRETIPEPCGADGASGKWFAGDCSSTHFYISSKPRMSVGYSFLLIPGTLHKLAENSNTFKSSTHVHSLKATLFTTLGRSTVYSLLEILYPFHL